MKMLEHKIDSLKEKNLLRNSANFADLFLNSTFQYIGSFFAMPSFLNKKLKKQDVASKHNIDINNIIDNRSKTLGFIYGKCMGIILGGNYLYYSALEALDKGNYIPLAALGLANFASVSYELVRK